MAISNDQNANTATAAPAPASSPAAPSAANAAAAPTSAPTRRPRPPARCRFFAQGKCREGDKCRFRHVPPAPGATPAPEKQDGDASSRAPDATRTKNTRRRDGTGRPPRSAGLAANTTPANGDTTAAATAAPTSSGADQETDAAVPAAPAAPAAAAQKARRNRPRRDRDQRDRARRDRAGTPSTTGQDNDQDADPADAMSQRTLELQHLRAQYRTKRATATRVLVDFAPSDPDFPYPLESVNLALTVPLDYPDASMPSIEVLNDDIPDNLKDMVAIGYASRVQQRPRLPLATTIQWLDKNLESLLAGKMQQSSRITFVRNTRSAVAKPTGNADRRVSEMQQLARRFKSTWVQLSELEVQFSFEPTDPDFPLELTLHFGLTVPKTYPDEPATLAVLNTDVPPSVAAAIQDRFHAQAAASPGMGLLALVNWLDRNLLDILRAVEEEQEAEDEEHVHNGHCSHTSSGSGSDSTDDDEDDGDNTGDDLPESAATTDPVKSGTQIRVPDLHLSGIGVVEPAFLSFLANCARCKCAVEFKDVPPVRPGTDLTPTVAHPWPGGAVRTCPQCATQLGVRYTAALAHPGSKILGTANTLNTHLVDLLPSSFTPTCAACTNPAPGLFKSVPRGVPVAHTCRRCHAAMALAVDLVRFQHVGAGGLVNGGPGGAMGMLKKRVRRADEGIVPGQPLPNEGRCKHYAKSYRWFRFPCCGRVYACDICHEKNKPDDHDVVRANRMVCGFCSKEQPFAQGDCSFCHARLVAKASSGFWEGGKGTRDKNRMSAKDARKFKDSNSKTKSKKSERVGAAGVQATKKKQQRRGTATDKESA
ncbi:hypothetical protein AMAG_12079 [Allomyces macrogynus ATCC 38327]|uniref:C3H1-type domain-containing protein n=1 Tax=Allomyces macrogynus (strain ATCC 38327) TaxID=578462 RepID=A0A0L0SYP9_ALLM3|nr:hypothetical protein AMAG_12079 [Allomyces macrogynus ATCC 38327]|eukprot:KNE67626.1 hypothetical protein AMAG_12079 [Allomyces macrogynus ATCC 38327]